MYNVNMNVKHLHKLVWMSRPLMQAAEACVEKGLGGTDLTVRMRAVLEILRRYGDQSVPELAAQLEIKRQYVQLMVNETLASGFTDQRANPRHKRSKLICLTDRGRHIIDRIIADELALMADIGEGFSDNDIAKALEVVLTVTERLKSVAGESR